MPQQLIYTSAPRGVAAGRSGHCTVARSATMREALVLRLEQLSYYQHLSFSGREEHPIYACRVVDIRGTRYHVLSRLMDAGLDFTGRTNFIAHHLVIAPEEINPMPIPPVILRDWSGWVSEWTKGPELFENEDWSGLMSLSGRSALPAQTWQKATGDAVNAYALLETERGACFRVDIEPEELLLGLFAESLELLHVRDRSRDAHVTAWQYTFTTSLQERDNPADFHWRCIHPDNPAFGRLAGGDCRNVSAIRASHCSGEEIAMARAGRQKPRFINEPQDLRIWEGESARFNVSADGVPDPTYQWLAVDRQSGETILSGETKGELVMPNPPVGVSRYAVRAANIAGAITSRVVTLSVETGPRSAESTSHPGHLTTFKPAAARSKPEGRIPQPQERMIVEPVEEAEETQGRDRGMKLFLIGLLLALVSTGVVLGWKKHASQAPVTVETTPVSNPPVEPVVKVEERSAPAVTAPKVEAAPVETLPQVEPTRPFVLHQDSFQKVTGPWISKSIGNVAVKTSAITDDRLYSFSGSGQMPLAGPDNFFYVYQTVSNAVQFSARLSRMDNANQSRCGLMIRESEKQDCPFVFVGASSEAILWLQRSSAGAPCISTSIPARNRNLFYRLQRGRDRIVAEVSADGNTWMTVREGEASQIPQANYLIGFAICSGSPAVAVNAQFNSVSLKPLEGDGR